ncbi:AMP-binding protein, partial [Cupriavidus respiraculi]|uniref:AMP-binding protein n=1 Tax=Cupriavidus respiraculi TaxID=195930 RepID=UPI001C98ACD7
YVAILRQIAANPDALVGTLGLLDEIEQRQLREWNAVDDRFREVEPVHVAIARRAAAQPDAIAVRCGDRALSYADLESSASRLALALCNAGVSPEAVVGVVLDRSPELLVRLLAVLKAGAAYLPLDPELPSHRIAYLLDDARVSMILTTGDLVDSIPSGLPTVLMEDAGEEDGTLPSVSPHQLAYLIYTSGSTGTPKGVAVEHGPLAMHCHATAVQYGMTPDDREL